MPMRAHAMQDFKSANDFGGEIIPEAAKTHNVVRGQGFLSEFLSQIAAEFWK